MDEDVYDALIRVATQGNYYPSTIKMLRFFSYSHLHPSMQGVSKIFCQAALDLLGGKEGSHAGMPIDEPEVSIGLRKLLEAKDCFVRALV